MYTVEFKGREAGEREYHLLHNGKYIGYLTEGNRGVCGSLRWPAESLAECKFRGPLGHAIELAELKRWKIKRMLKRLNSVQTAADAEELAQELAQELELDTDHSESHHGIDTGFEPQTRADFDA